MSTPVVTEKWAGQFDCSVCRRKRLMAEEFSKKALERHRKTGGDLKCKDCVGKAEAAERDAAAARRKDQPSTAATTTAGSGANNEQRECAACSKELGVDAFNRNQWSKGTGKSRCRTCVESAIQAEKVQQEQGKTAAIEEARVALEKANLNPKDTMGIVKAASRLSALEAEQVTGLKPKIIRRPGRGGGRMSGRSSGRGRGGAKR